MLVYRIENADGLGPYQSAQGQFSRAWDMCEAHSTARHAGPWSPDSGLGGITFAEYCGLNSPEALLEWFYDFLVELDQEGFHVSVYSSEDARVGRWGQTLFRREDAVMIERMTCEKLLALV